MKPPKAAQGDPGKTEDSSELVYALSYAGTLGFCPYTALSQVSIAAIKHHDQKRLGEEWFIPSYKFTVRPKGKAGTEPEAGGGGALLTGLLSLTCSVRFLTYPTEPPALRRHHPHWARPCHINH